MKPELRSESARPEPDLRWNIRRRLERIDLLLMWDGKVNRSDLTSFFGISDPQASSDLTRYREEAPGNVIYDTSARRYVVSENFRPAFVEPNPDRYLAQLRLIAADVISPKDLWIQEIPPFDALRTLRGRVDPWMLRTMLDAMRGARSVEIEYQSMSRPKPTRRSISPHALAFDGRRWHVRAYCHESDSFRDFVLSRMLEVGGTSDSEVDAADDRDWQELQEVRLRPHPDLTPAQQRIIAIDFGMEKQRLVLNIRKCMLIYFINCYRLDPKKYILPPHEQQIILQNADEVLSIIEN